MQRGVFEEPRQGVDETRRAKPTLRTVVINHRLLNRAEFPVVCDPLDCDYVRAVELMDRGNARDDGPIAMDPLSAAPARTVQAPQSPSAHPILVPTRPRWAAVDHRQKNGIPGDRQPLSVHINDDMIPHTIGTLEQRARSK